MTVMCIIGGYIIYGLGGGEDMSSGNKIKGTPKVINVSDMSNVGAGGADVGKGLAGLAQYLAAAIGLFANDKKNEKIEGDKFVKHTYTSFDAQLIPFQVSPTFRVYSVQKDTVLLKSKMDTIDWELVSKRDSIYKSQEAERLNNKHKLK